MTTFTQTKGLLPPYTVRTSSVILSQVILGDPPHAIQKDLRKSELHARYTPQR